MAVSKTIKDDIRKKRDQKEENIRNYRQELLVVDAEKEPYDEAVKALDLDILSSIDKVNQAIYETQTAYQNRIDSGCYSDLFWRVTGSDEDGLDLIVDQLNPVGYGYSVIYVEPVTGVATTLESTTKVGLTTQNLYGLKYYDHPYLKDIGDTTLGTFIGQIGLGSTILNIISQTAEELTVGFETGNVITCSKAGVFPSPTNTIVGFGTTVVTGISTSLADITGISTDVFYTASIILKDATIGVSSLPEADGSYVNYTVVISPEDFEAQKPRFKYKVKFTKNPYSPETIGILNSSTAGTGYKVELDNSGYPSSAQDWKPELEGIERQGEKVKEPNVGAGKIYFRTGFTYRPVIGGSPATKGTTLTGIATASLPSYYGSTPSCSSSINNLISSATNNQTEKENALNGSCVANVEDVANGIRDERNEYALRIWGMRQSIGNQNDELDKLEALDTYINQKSSVIDGETSSNCV
jgi:hypothetical protein